MDSSRVNLETHPTVSPSSTDGERRSNNDSNSSEFEFWMVRNPSLPQPNLLTADQLFVDGVLLPLHQLYLRNNSNPSEPNPEPSKLEPHSRNTEHEPGPGLEINFESAAPLSASKRWKDIFKKGDKNKKSKTDPQDKENKKKDKKSGISNASSSAELYINLWPFSRSRTAGNGCTRPITIFGARKVYSAPCSRSNSAGDSKSRKRPSSPGRTGVHLGRSRPVWKIRRGWGKLGFEKLRNPCPKC